MLQLAALLTLAVVGPQAPAGDTTVVHGTVFDSIATHPLVGASVQLVRADSGAPSRVLAATTDSAGHFTIRGVPRGRYIAGFFHPMLDTLGLELRDRVVDLRGDTATMTLATPSPRTLIRGFCGDSSTAMLPTLLFGSVHDARDESAVENASVAVVWPETEQTSTGLDIVERSGQATTRRAGFFALCGVPTEAALSVRAARAKDTAVVNTRIPSSGVLHLTLFMGAAGTTGRIVGHITDREKRPIAAHTSASGRETVANSAGRFVFDNVPTGSQSIDVRSIGYAPLSMIVNVADGPETNVDIVLERIVTLPTTESRAAAASDHLARYLQTKRTDPTGARFIEPSRLDGYPATQSVCALVSILRGASVCRTLENCDAFFLNGTRVVYQLNDIDADDILGVEVFSKHWPATYEAYRLVRAPITCGIVVYTRCPGIELRCGDNPASKPIRRPEDTDADDLATPMIGAHLKSDPTRTRV
jgi:hypothetical protein